VTAPERRDDVVARPRSVWPWAVLLILLSLAVWWTFRPSRAEPVVADGSTLLPDSGSVVGPDRVRGFLAFIANSRASRAMAPDHEFITSAIDMLADALAALATSRTPGVDAELAAIRAHARAIRAESQSLAHADTTRAAFVRLASVMHSIQVDRLPSRTSAVTLVRQAAERIDPGRPLLEQREAVQRFLDRSADVIRALADDTGSVSA
jgi:hypothetical protein